MRETHPRPCGAIGRNLPAKYPRPRPFGALSLPLAAMPYTPKARALRRCTHVHPAGHARAGEPCRAFALWDDPHGRCAPHAGRTRGRERTGAEPYECATRPRCHCRAYAFPHRPGGGLCRWPDEPTHTDPTPAGLHPYGYRLRRPKGYAGTWAHARRRSFDVTPPGVCRRSRGAEVLIVTEATARALFFVLQPLQRAAVDAPARPPGVVFCIGAVKVC